MVIVDKSIFLALIRTRHSSHLFCFLFRHNNAWRNADIFLLLESRSPKSSSTSAPSLPPYEEIDRETITKQTLQFLEFVTGKTADDFAREEEEAGAPLQEDVRYNAPCFSSSHVVRI